jgi:hypothetical protein
MAVTLTFDEVHFVIRCVERMRLHAEQTAAEFRLEPVNEAIAQSYDQDVARAAALLARLVAAFATTEA